MYLTLSWCYVQCPPLNIPVFTPVYLLTCIPVRKLFFKFECKLHTLYVCTTVKGCQICILNLSMLYTAGGLRCRISSILYLQTTLTAFITKASAGIVLTQKTKSTKYAVLSKSRSRHDFRR